MSKSVPILNNKNKIVNIILIVILLGVIGFMLYTIFKPKKIEPFSDLVDLEKFGSLDDLDLIKTDVSTIRKKLLEEYPDLSRFVQKSDLPPSTVCRVATAVDKDSYLSKVEVDKLQKCPVPYDYDPTKYISKSLAQSQAVTTCPTLNPDQWVLKSTLPPKEVAPPCICPKVKVSAGLCQKCPPPPKCPEVKPCPILECPAPKPCPPQKECPACPPKEDCPLKICAPCPSVCSSCKKDINSDNTTDSSADFINMLKKSFYVDQNGNQVKSPEELTNIIKNLLSPGSSPTPTANYTLTPTPAPTVYNSDDNNQTNYDRASSVNHNSNNPTPSSNSGLATPSPTPTFNGSTSTGGSLNEQSNAGSSIFSLFSRPTDKPFVQSYKVDNNNNKSKSCKSGAFNSEFQQYGIYGSNKNMYNDYLAL